MKKLSLVVLAAGVGSRYGGFKQIEPIGPNGEIILDYCVFDALRAGFSRVVIVTRPDLEQPMREHFRQTLGERFELQFTFQRLDDLPEGFSLPPQRQKPWGTAHAVWAARDALDGPFAVINADDFYGPSSYRVLADFLGTQQNDDYCMVGFQLGNTLSEHGTVARGICRSDAAGNLIEVVEHTKIECDPAGGARTMGADGAWHALPLDATVSLNFWGFNASIFAHLERQFRDFLQTHREDPKAEFFIPSVVDRVIKQGISRCRVLKTSEHWFGVTYKQDRPRVATAIRALVEQGVYPAKLATE